MLDEVNKEQRPRYYKVDTRKATFLEHWRVSTTLMGFIIGALYKILGIPLNTLKFIPEPTTLKERFVEQSELPPNLAANLKPHLHECLLLGFGDTCFQMLKFGPVTTGQAAMVCLLHSSGETIANIVSVKFRSREKTVFGFFSFLSDDKVLVTSNRAPSFDDLPGNDIERIIKGSPSQLWQRHLERLEKIRPVNSPKRFSAFDAYEKQFEVFIKKTFERNVQRGLLVEMSVEEIEAGLKKHAVEGAKN